MLSLQWKFPFPRRLFTSLNLLRLLWLLLLFYVEHFIYLRAIQNCSWQVDAPKDCRLAIVADPQIVDENTYSRRGLAMWLTQVFTDRYMRRNWAMLMKQEPGTVIFLGDLMDGGREWDDDKWIPEYKRFQTVFPPVEGTRTVTTIPGNHDIGLGDGITISRLTRFRHQFTEQNATSQILETCNFELILFDTPSILNTNNAEVFDPPSHFLDNMPDPKPDVGRILFTHIPLFRPPDTPCGAFRESSRPIFYGGGYQYQNTMPQDISTRILDTLWPVSAVFTGDDHDYCLVNHELEGRRESVPEYTVKSFSMAMGIKYPGYHIISLGKVGDRPGFETKLCLLPSPITGYILYAVMGIISCVWIVFVHCTWRTRKEVEYIELDNLWNVEEQTPRRRRLLRCDIRGIAREAGTMGLFIFGCMVLQIIGVY